MKKVIPFLLCLTLLLLISCSKKQKTDSAVEQALDQIDRTEEALRNVKLSDGTVIDYDLTQMNANMIYAQVFNLMLSPDEYEGKVFRMKGSCLNVKDIDGNPSYAVIIKDALACCQQGLEFKYDFGSDIPSDGDELLVTGKFMLFTREDGMSYNYLEADSVEKLR